MVPCKNTAEEVSFEWSHHRISTTDSKVTLHYMSLQLTLRVKELYEFGHFGNICRKGQRTMQRRRILVDLVNKFYILVNRK